jgi:hypothetical protein
MVDGITGAMAAIGDRSRSGGDGGLYRQGGSEGGDGEEIADLRRHLMGYAAITLRWSPDQFWRATPHEFYAAVEFTEWQAKKAREV